MSNSTPAALSNQKGKSKKRALPTSFLDCRSLIQVPKFPSSSGRGGGEQNERQVISIEVTSDVGKQIFLERFVKEIVQPFRPFRGGQGTFVMTGDGKLRKSKGGESDIIGKKQEKNAFWKNRLKIGTNQCLKALESKMDGAGSTNPSLIVMAKDVYPPTMLVHVPVLAQERSIPLLILPGKASSELGRALGIRKTTLLLFMESNDTSVGDKAVNSFVEFVISQIPSLNE